MTTIDEKAKHLIIQFEIIIHKYIKYLASQDDKYIIKEDQLTIQDRKVITHLGKHESLTMRELADLMMLAVSTMTGIVDKLVNKNWVERVRSIEDRRVVKVSLTKTGWDIYNLDYKHRLHFMESMLQALNEKDQDDFCNLVQKTAQNFITDLKTK